MAEILEEQMEALRQQQKHNQAPAGPSSGKQQDENQNKDLPKGVVLDKDGKPCRLCTSAASWKTMAKRAAAASTATTTAAATTSTSTSTSSATQDECPPDVEALGRSSWTLLHSLTAAYPSTASPEQQTEMKSFLSLFSRLYPCWVCADDFRTWMADPRNAPRLSGRAEFGNWMCEAHNAVNRKLGKKEFDCRFWEERWRTGWKDGRCD
ncbi:FAD dependent sulfhydryl oxidase Erv1, putative [Paecilomyces variotii No. 5]|uniref:Sulfhydryl oxidase n=1 Tax=Byssochlamys spectabilis (strain No. 5 / NBRC 109023) TaxID=1356009 RepID=V5G4R4_BYSSN|nr:FAD dependent sulfhydryl oxidase Erv1, putative [Paecilomyces variotii No. 5]